VGKRGRVRGRRQKRKEKKKMWGSAKTPGSIEIRSAEGKEEGGNPQATGKEGIQKKEMGSGWGKGSAEKTGLTIREGRG